LYCKDIYLCKRAEKPWQPSIILKAIFSGLPFLIVRNFSQEATTTIKKLLETNTYDVIHAETFYIMPHIPPTETPVLLVEQTIEYKVYQHFISTLSFLFRLPLSLDIFKLKYWEKFYWSKADLVATVSEADQKEITKLLPSTKSVIIPNGAGDDMFVDKFPKLDIKKPILLFVGNFFWLQNIEAAQYLLDKIFPDLAKRIPGVELIIAGQNSTKLASSGLPNIKLSILNRQQRSGKNYTNQQIYLLPDIWPRWYQIKKYWQVWLRLPVICTKTGVEGLDENGKHFLIAHT
jgi:hypothetical protein